MKTTPKLQQFVKQLAAKHGLDLHATGTFLCLELKAEAPWARLIVENLAASRTRIACQLYLFDEWVDEPSIVFWITATGDWAPIEVEQIQDGWQGYAALDPQGELEDFYDPERQAKLARFAEDEVVANLTEQGWLTHGRRVEQARIDHFVGCQSDHAGPCYGELWQCATCGKTVCYAEGTDNHPEVCDDCWVKQYGTQEEVDNVPF